MLSYIAAMMKPMVGILLEGSGVVPDLPVTGGYILEALAAQGHPADNVTAAAVHNIALQQAADGRWVGWAIRPPLEGSDIQATAYAIRAIKLYPIQGRREEMDQRVAHAARWLRTAVAVTTEEHTTRILGLKWAGLDAREIEQAAQQLLRMQRADGGWSQLSALSSDAYATAKAVYTLKEVYGPGNRFVQRGVAYLRSTQLADGTWHVKSRSFALQPLKDTDFPHGRDQWISAAATSWAVIALSQDQMGKLQTKTVQPAARPSSAGPVAARQVNR
ncbi:MAG TPA: prenyltransferase/squalene oxidase repeat-containing protein [Bryobacteraceae bacterium]|nr:prenyltransferase/squalene oxidase repeat-containing protein [Bryobacteraceae bacterium]